MGSFIMQGTLRLCRKRGVAVFHAKRRPERLDVVRVVSIPQGRARPSGRPAEIMSSEPSISRRQSLSGRDPNPH